MMLGSVLAKRVAGGWAEGGVSDLRIGNCEDGAGGAGSVAVDGEQRRSVERRVASGVGGDC